MKVCEMNIEYALGKDNNPREYKKKESWISLGAGSIPEQKQIRNLDAVKYLSLSLSHETS